jgi:hypothetical protein
MIEIETPPDSSSNNFNCINSKYPEFNIEYIRAESSSVYMYDIVNITPKNEVPINDMKECLKDIFKNIESQINTRIHFSDSDLFRELNSSVIGDFDFISYTIAVNNFNLHIDISDNLFIIPVEMKLEDDFFEEINKVESIYKNLKNSEEFPPDVKKYTVVMGFRGNISSNYKDGRGEVDIEYGHDKVIFSGPDLYNIILTLKDIIKENDIKRYHKSIFASKLYSIKL